MHIVWLVYLTFFSWIKSDSLEQNLSVYFEKKLEKMCDPDPTVLASPLAGGARETLRARGNQQSFLQLLPPEACRSS